jgi:hypothetical protein
MRFEAEENLKRVVTMKAAAAASPQSVMFMATSS